MIPILYESNETAFTSNGVGRLRDCITCTVTEERNGIYECDFEYPIAGAHFDDIKCGRIIAVRHDDSDDVQPFDIVSFTAPIGGVVTFHAVHISYRLSYLTTWATNINSLTEAFGVLNSISGSPFTFSADFTSSAYMGAFDGVPRTARQLMGGIEGSVLDAYGGEYEFNNFSIILHRNRGTERDFTIRYGVNLLDYQEDTDYQGAYTSCVPYWVGQDALGRDTVVRGARVDSGLPTVTGRLETVPLDLTEKFESKPTATQLQNMAASMMSSKQVNLPAQTIKVDFIRLQDFEEFEQFETLLQCNLCDRIKVSFPRYNMTGFYKIVRTVWDVLEGRYKEMELGALSTSLAEALGISQGTTAKDSAIEDLAMVGDLSVGGTVTAYNAQSAAQFKTLGTATHAYIELDAGASGSKVLRLVSNTNGNIGLYDPAISKWIIRNDTNGKTYLSGRSTSFGGILGGTLASTSVAGGAYVDKAITFSEAFDAAPTVVCSISSTSTSTDIGSITAAAINVTATGFTIRIFNNSANTRAPAVNWIALA